MMTQGEPDPATPRSTAPLPVLALDSVTVGFGGVVALADVSLTVEANEVVGLIGPNGAGKTTLCNCIGGIVGLKAGIISYHGTRIDRLPAYRRAQRGIARTFQTPALFERLSVFDNVLAAAEHGGLRSEARAAAHRLLTEFGLGGLAARSVRQLSMGYKKRVELARALACGPSLLLLDEPTAGIPLEEAHSIIASVVSARTARPLAILLIEHNLPIVMAHSDRVVVLDRGSVIAEGRPEEIRANRVVRNAYRGQLA